MSHGGQNKLKLELQRNAELEQDPSNREILIIQSKNPVERVFWAGCHKSMKFGKSFSMAIVRRVLLFRQERYADVGRNLTGGAGVVGTDEFFDADAADGVADQLADRSGAGEIRRPAGRAGRRAGRPGAGFFTRFSGDTNAPQARVVEIQALKMATHFGATNRLADLDARERVMLGDTNAPEELRYEVRLDLLGRELQARAAAGADMKAELEKAGRGW